MKAVPVLLLALAASWAAAEAPMQWKWRDPRGVIVYSDTPPPRGTPEGNIIERPPRWGQPGAGAQQAPPAPQAASAPAPAARRGTDQELEARVRKSEQDRAEKEALARKVEDERVAALKAENCKRARNALHLLEEGIRLVRQNEKGEREVLDDKMRAEEMAHARATIASDCK